MALLPDPEAPPRKDRRLAAGLLGLFGALMLMAIAVHKLVPRSSDQRTPATASSSSPLLSRPQLLESELAMPELADFGPQTPPPDRINWSDALGTPGSPSTLGERTLP